MLTHRITLGWSSGATNIAQSFDLSAGAEQNIDEEIPAASVDRQVAFSLPVAQTSVFFMVSDRDLTVKTNNAGAPANTFTLKAGVPFLWTDGSPAMRDHAGAIVANITALYVTNADPDNAAGIRVRSLTDPTV